MIRAVCHEIAHGERDHVAAFRRSPGGSQTDVSRDKLGRVETAGAQFSGVGLLDKRLAVRSEYRQTVREVILIVRRAGLISGYVEPGIYGVTRSVSRDVKALLIVFFAKKPEILDCDGRRRNDRHAAHVEWKVAFGFTLSNRILHNKMNTKLTGGHKGGKQKRHAAFGCPIFVFRIQFILDIARNRRRQ